MRDRGHHATACAPAAPRTSRRRSRGLRLIGGLLLAAAHLHPAPAWGAAEPVILTLSTNGVARGEFTLLRQDDGDYWIGADDAQRLGVRVDPAARRAQASEGYYSLRALGAARVDYDEPNLSLAVDFPTDLYKGVRIDLGARPETGVATAAARSLILSYRLNLQGSGATRSATLDNALNVRVGKLLLRQETRLSSQAQARGFARGATQLVWDEPTRAMRVAAGDVISTAGPFGSAITGAGVLVQRVYDMRPDVIRQPTASIRTAATSPAEVVVDVDGSPVFRGTVAPGPIDISNLLQYGGLRNVRVTVTDASGRREVIEQPFFFTSTVLAQGLHEFSYFAGRKSELGPDLRWRYGPQAWQGYHRIGITDAVTVGAGGEGSSDFTNTGAGIALRADRLGVVSLEALASRNRVRDVHARGWSWRYLYTLPAGTVFLGRRMFEDGFTSFTTSALSPFLRSESSVGMSTSLGPYSLTAQWSRSRDAFGPRSIASVRASTALGPRQSLAVEVLQNREAGRRDLSAFLLFRMELDGQRWLSSSVERGGGGHLLSTEAGSTLPQGEGAGWRAGVTAASRTHTAIGFASASWNHALATVDVNAAAPQSGGGGFGQVAVSGALAAVDGFWGVTRRIDDSFVVARLGVPQPGVEVSINSQVQGRTDEAGMLLIPQVISYAQQQVSVNDRQVGLQYDLRERQRPVVAAFRSGNVIDFGGRAIRAVAGYLWRVDRDGRTALSNLSVVLHGPDCPLVLETGSSGDFYVENAAVVRYAGRVTVEDRRYECRLEVPAFSEPVFEVPGGVTCE